MAFVTIKFWKPFQVFVFFKKVANSQSFFRWEISCRGVFIQSRVTLSLHYGGNMGHNCTSFMIAALTFTHEQNIVYKIENTHLLKSIWWLQIKICYFEKILWVSRHQQENECPLEQTKNKKCCFSPFNNVKYFCVIRWRMAIPYLTTMWA